MLLEHILIISNKIFTYDLSHLLAAPSRGALPVTKNFYRSAMEHYKNLFPEDNIIFIVASGKLRSHT